MEDNGPEIEVAEDARICSGCIGEAFLRVRVEKKGKSVVCDYCGQEGSTFTLVELSHEIRLALEHHFQRVVSQADKRRFADADEDERPLDWNIAGEPVSEVIAAIALIAPEPAEHVRQVLASVAGEEYGLFEPETCYARRETSVFYDLFQLGWKRLELSLKTEARMFNTTAQVMLDAVFEDLESLRTREGRSVIVAAGPGRALTSLFRARVFQSTEKLQRALQDPVSELAAPPRGMGAAGRMNARGVGVFYAATDPLVALAEVRPPVGSRVVVARFDVAAPLRLIDVEALRSVLVTGSVFDSMYLHYLERAQFLRELSERITMPVMPDDEPTDYLVTQAIADYLSQLEEPRVDGIIYRSVQRGANGVNVAVFHKSAAVRALEYPEETKIHASVKDGPPYHVMERVPPSGPEQAPLPFPACEADFSSREGSLLGDNREPTLAIDVASITVHHIEAVEIAASSHVVYRNRSEQIEQIEPIS